MESNNQSCCSVCWKILSDSEILTKASDNVEILKCLLTNANHKLIQESIICEACLAKVQSAYKFKILYSEDSQKTLDNDTVKEETNSENLMCEICKKILDPSDSVPFVNSESNLSTLIRHFPKSKICENLRTCEKCHKSLLNFSTVMNLISVFEKNSAVINEFDIAEKINVTYDSNSDSFKVDIKEKCAFQDVKEEMDCTVQGVKEENEDDSTSQEFMLKNEEVDLKSDVDSEDETYSKFGTQTTSIGNHPKSANGSKFQAEPTDTEIDKTEYLFECLDCDYRTKYKKHINRHLLVHSNNVEMFQCNVCKYQTKYKANVIKHMLVHKNTDDVEMFPCNICQFQSKHKTTLKKHMLTHKAANDIEMFQCNVCTFQSKYKYSLRNHVLTHKAVDEVQMFQCNLCKYQSKRQWDLKQHMLRHKNIDETEMFYCTICSYRSKRKSYLTKHMKAHKDQSID